MNKTVDVALIHGLCLNCQTSYGFSSADRRSIIILVVLAAIALLLCYVSVLWFAIRTRFISEPPPPILAVTNLQFNPTFNERNEFDDDLGKPVATTRTPPVTLKVEHEKERY